MTATETTAPLRTATPVAARAAAAAGSAATLGRWRQPAFADRAAFLAEHPECRLTDAQLDGLRSEISYRASQLGGRAMTAEVRDDLETDIIAGILEAATKYRTVGADGQPVFDFLAQSKRYIVQHASHAACTNLRRDRRQVFTVPLASPLDALDHEDGLAGDRIPDPVDPSTVVSIAQLVAQDEADTRLVSAIRAQLGEAQRATLDLLLRGTRRAEVPGVTGLARQRVHEHVEAIRTAYLRVGGPGGGPVLAVLEGGTAAYAAA